MTSVWSISVRRADPEKANIRDGRDFVDEVEYGIEEIWWILEGQDYHRL